MPKTPVVLLPLTLLGLLAACKGDDPTDDTAAFPWDRGCITVNDTPPGFLHLRDAVTVAEAGSVITLCGPLEETVRVDKSLVIEGPEDASVLWSAPASEGDDLTDPALVVSAGVSVELARIDLTAAYSTILVEEGGELTATDVRVFNEAAHGIEATQATVRGTRLEVSGALWGGIRMRGGVLELTESTLAGNTTYAVGLESEAIATILDSSLTDTLPSDATGANFDGFAVTLTGASLLTSRGNTYADNVLGAVFAGELSTVTSSGDAFDTNWSGAWLENSTLVLTEATFTGGLQYDVLGQNATLDVADSTFSHDPTTSPLEDTTSNLSGGYGILLFDGSLGVTNASFTGHNGGALYLSGSPGSVLPVTLTDVTVEETTGSGITLVLADAELTNVDLLGVQDNLEGCEVDGVFYCDWALAALEADVSWTGGRIEGNASVGAIAQSGSFTGSGLSFRDNDTFSLWGLDAAVSVADSSFGGTGELGVYLASGTLALMDRVTFEDRSYVDVSDYVDFVYRWHYSAWEASVYDSSLTLRDSTFTNGESGIEVLGSSSDPTSAQLTLEDTTFDGYNEYVIYNYGSTVELDGADLTNIGGRAVYCSYGVTRVQDTRIAGLTEIEDAYEVFDADGNVLTSLEDSRYASQRAALYALNCSIDLEDTLFEDIQGQALYGNDTVVQLQDVDFRAVHTAPLTTGHPSPSTSSCAWDCAVDLFWDLDAPTVLAEDVSITGVGTGAALGISNTVEDATDSTVELRRLTVGAEASPAVAGVAGDGLRLTGLPNLLLEDFLLEDVGGDGLVLTDTTARLDGTPAGATLPGAVRRSGGSGVRATASALTLSGLEVDQTGGDGLTLEGGSATLQQSTVSGAGAHGLRATGTDLTLDEVTVVEPTLSGVWLSGGHHTLSRVSSTLAGEWGMQCDVEPEVPLDSLTASVAPTFDTCSLTAAEGTLGSLDACTGCVVEPIP